MDRREFIKGALLTGVVVSGIVIAGNELQSTSSIQPESNNKSIEK